MTYSFFITLTEAVGHEISTVNIFFPAKIDHLPRFVMTERERDNNDGEK